jgi:hypothetical protein
MVGQGSIPKRDLEPEVGLMGNGSAHHVILEHRVRVSNDAHARATNKYRREKVRPPRPRRV